jgi:hypothetical protein
MDHHNQARLVRRVKDTPSRTVAETALWLRERRQPIPAATGIAEKHAVTLRPRRAGALRQLRINAWVRCWTDAYRVAVRLWSCNGSESDRKPLSGSDSKVTVLGNGVTAPAAAGKQALLAVWLGYNLASSHASA